MVEDLRGTGYGGGTDSSRGRPRRRRELEAAARRAKPGRAPTTTPSAAPQGRHGSYGVVKNDRPLKQKGECPRRILRRLITAIAPSPPKPRSGVEAGGAGIRSGGKPG